VAVAIVSWLAYLLVRSTSGAKAVAERPDQSDPLPGQSGGQIQGGPEAAL